MTVKDRIKSFCKAENITISAFEESIGVSNGYVNAISRSLGIDKLNTIIEKYSNLNIEWLLTGKGEMYKTKCSLGDIPNANQSSCDNKDKENYSKVQENSPLFSDLLETIKEQAETIGRLKARIEDLESQIADSPSDMSNVG